MTPSRGIAVTSGVALLILSLSAGPASAQASASAPLAAELTQLLQQAELDSVAAKIPGSENRFAAALLFGTAQLLVVSAEYSAPTLLEPTIAEKNYRDVYLELQSASIPESKVFVTDFGANGVVRAPAEEDQPADTWEAAGARTLFNGDWRAQSMSESDYDTRFGEADSQYAEILGALIAEIK